MSSLISVRFWPPGRSGFAPEHSTLIDLVGSIGQGPDVVTQDGVRTEDLPALLRRRIESLRPILESLRADSSAPDVQELAQDLVEYLAGEG
jgi:hypothetical protein